MLPAPLAELEQQYQQLLIDVKEQRIPLNDAYTRLATLTATDAAGHTWSLSAQHGPPNTVFLKSENGNKPQPANPNTYALTPPRKTPSLPDPTNWDDNNTWNDNNDNNWDNSSWDDTPDILTPPDITTPPPAPKPAKTTKPGRQPRQKTPKQPGPNPLERLKPAVAKLAGRIPADRKTILLITGAVLSLLTIVTLARRDTTPNTPAIPGDIAAACSATTSQIDNTSPLVAAKLGCVGDPGDPATLTRHALTINSDNTYSWNPDTPITAQLVAATVGQLASSANLNIPSPTGSDPLAGYAAVAIDAGLAERADSQPISVRQALDSYGNVLRAADTIPATSDITEQLALTIPDPDATLTADMWLDITVAAFLKLRDTPSPNAPTATFGTPDTITSNTTTTSTPAVTAPTVERVQTVLNTLVLGDLTAVNTIIADSGAENDALLEVALYVGLQQAGLTLTPQAAPALTGDNTATSRVTIARTVGGGTIAELTLDWTLVDSEWILSTWPQRI